MKLVKLATEWAKAEVFSTRFFYLVCAPIFNCQYWLLAVGKNRFSEGVYHSDSSCGTTSNDHWRRFGLYEHKPSYRV